MERNAEHERNVLLQQTGTAARTVARARRIAVAGDVVMSKRGQSTDYAAELGKEYARWDEVFTKGGSDPFWTDGVNYENKNVM